MFMLAMLLLPAFVGAEDVKLPDGVKAISTEELKAMLDRGEKVAVINSLSALEFTQTKIKGSINVPYGKLRDGEASLPADKETALVFYCLGPR
jgi:rhodanese-related sulfurtransferase